MNPRRQNGPKNWLPGDQIRVPNAQNRLSEVQSWIQKAQNRLSKVPSCRATKVGTKSIPGGPKLYPVVLKSNQRGLQLIPPSPKIESKRSEIEYKMPNWTKIDFQVSKIESRTPKIDLKMNQRRQNGPKNWLPGDQIRVPNAQNRLSEVQTWNQKAQNRLSKVQPWTVETPKSGQSRFLEAQNYTP